MDAKDVTNIIADLDRIIASAGHYETPVISEIDEFKKLRVDFSEYTRSRYIRPVIYDLSRMDKYGRQIILCDIFSCTPHSFAATNSALDWYKKYSDDLYAELEKRGESGLSVPSDDAFNAIGLLVAFYIDLLKLIKQGSPDIDVDDLLRRLGIYESVLEYFKTEMLDKNIDYSSLDAILKTDNVKLRAVRSKTSGAPRVCHIHALWEILNKNYDKVTRENKALFIEAITGGGVNALNVKPKSTYAYSNMPAPNKKMRNDTAELLALLEK